GSTAVSSIAAIGEDHSPFATCSARPRAVRAYLHRLGVQYIAILCADGRNALVYFDVGDLGGVLLVYSRAVPKLYHRLCAVGRAADGDLVAVNLLHSAEHRRGSTTGRSC